MSTLFLPSRRAFLQQGSLVLLAAGRPGRAMGWQADAAALQIGLLTDVHYADRPPQGTRFYREALGRTTAAVERFNERKCELAVMLGDFIDSADDEAGELAHLHAIEKTYAEFTGERHYVLGNHCVSRLTKEQFREHTGGRATHYAFDHAGIHFVVLDACYRADGVAYGDNNFVWTDTDIPESQRDWLRADLKSNPRPTIVFVHQRLDDAKDYTVKSAPAVRKILEDSGQVLAVLQGHSHANAYQAVGGIHYVTLRALVERSGAANNAFSILHVDSKGHLKIEGFQQQSNYEWPKGSLRSAPEADGSNGAG
jgi:predicted phosphodiesterase